jgi:heptosyltransferase-2
MLVGGEAEGALLEELTASVPEGRIGMERNRPLDRLAALLAGCGGFVGHDSGITHLAAAVGTPCVALWGPSVERVWRPAGAHVMVLRHADGLAALEVGSVYEAATAVAR